MAAILRSFNNPVSQLFPPPSGEQPEQRMLAYK